MQLKVMDKLLHVNAVKMQPNYKGYCTKHLTKYFKVPISYSFSNSPPFNNPKTCLFYKESSLPIEGEEGS